MRPVGPVPGQLVVGAGALAFAFLFSVAVALLIVIGGRIARWSRRRSAEQHDVGSDVLRLLDNLDADMDAYLLDHPDVAAGFDLLRAAVRDEQQEGGQS